ncbi:MAG: TrmJ/YjtD family RNA methyltransferase [Anaerolineae bacterium]|nr:TrmJ/YjtD family RNA methyltransferase [Gemmatimonadaceae bacterium]
MIDVDLLGNVVVVLSEPQDAVNIAAVVRAMKNMGIGRLRLVAPRPYDPYRIEGVAHGTEDIVRSIQHYDSLDAAVADCVRVAGFTARRRAAKRALSDPRSAANNLLSFASEGPVALVFGREDHGLPNEALDHVHLVVTIPTTNHASINLAQAVLIALYELHLAAPEASRTLAPPKKDAPPATSEQYELLFTDAARALEAMDFFRTRNPEHVNRTLRSIVSRAAPDSREIRLLRSMAIEVLRTIERIARRT